MSLDVYLTIPDAKVEQIGSGIFIRENGATKELTQQEWNEKFPDREPVKFESMTVESDEVYSANITHNLNKMAGEAGVYKALWYPEELGIKKAKDLIPKLTFGLNNLKSDPNYFKKYNPANGWGDYDGLVQFIENYLKACNDYPDADVGVSK